MKKNMVFSVGFFSLLLVASLAFAQDGAGTVAAQACSACHSTAKICEKLGTRNAEVWKQTVARMKSNGAKISDADVAAVAQYLSTAKPGAKPLCK